MVNLKFNRWQTYVYYLTWIFILILITFEEIYSVFNKSCTGKAGYYSHHNNFAQQILFSKSFINWYIAHHLAFHAYIC
jgi:hypothetical protein